MKLSNFILFATLSLTALTAQAELKAAYLDSAMILQKAPQAIKAIEAMKSEFASREQTLRSAAEALKTQETNLQKDGAIMSPDQRTRLEKEIVEKQRKLRFDAQSLKEDVDLRRKQEIQKLRTTISAVIQNYAKSKGYDFVFTEGVAFAADKINITQDILKELEK